MSGLSRNGVVRRLQRLSGRVRRAVARSPEGVATVLVNSVPKAGTNLVLQLLTASTGLTNWAQFAATRPSRTYAPRSDESLVKFLEALRPGELAGAHLEHSELLASAVRAAGIRMVLVVRDPRAIVVSEARYLAGMNRWHRLAPHFRALATDRERYALAIEGDPALGFPDVGRRMRWYEPWSAEPGCVFVRYEDLVADPAATFVSVTADLDLPDASFDASGLAAERSHTYREGTSEGWRGALTPEQATRVARLAGDTMTAWGYRMEAW